MSNIGIHGSTSTATVAGTVTADQGAAGADPWPVTTPGVVNAANSSTSNLAGNATFTGTGVEVLDYARVSVLVNSNVGSATNGVQIQWSSDNSTWVDSSTFTYTPGVSPNIGQIFIAGTRARYMRVVYINGSSAQSSFILATLFQPAGIGADVIDLSTSLVDSQHALLTKGLIWGRTTAGGGSYVGVKVSPSGALAVDSTIATTDLTASSPTFATVGVTSAQAVASNASRKGLVLVNTSNNVISLGFGATAVLNSGITLYPGGVFQMDVSIFDTGTVNAIASAASSNLAIQEYT